MTIDEISAHNDASLLELCEGWVIGIEASSFGTVVSTKTDYTQATLSNKATKGGDSSAFSIGTLIASAWNWLYNGTIVGKIGSAGISLVQGFGISNDADSARFTLSVGTNAAAAKASRNTATAVAAFRTENSNAASTGDIHEFANNSGVVAGVRKDGRMYGADGTASNDYITKDQLDLKANLTSPTFLGDPKAPTPVLGDSSTNIATTAFVNDAASVYGTQIEEESGATFTIVPSRKKVVLVLTGTTTTVTFPTVTGNEGLEIVVINKGAGDGDLVSSGGGNDFWDAGSVGSAAVVLSTEKATFINDGTHYSKV